MERMVEKVNDSDYKRYIHFLLILSLALSVREIQISVKELDLQLHDMEFGVTCKNDYSCLVKARFTRSCIFAKD